MSLQRLKAAEMVSLTAPLVKPGSAERNALAGVSELAVLVPHVDGAHQGVLTAQGLSVQDRQEPLVQALIRLDGRHDGLWRALHYVLEGCRQLALARGDAVLADRLAALQAKMMPDGMSVVTLSYREEAGAVALMASRLTAEDRALLATLTLNGEPLLAIVEQLAAVGAELGALENQRAEIRQSGGISTMNQARSVWTRTVVMLRNMIALLDSQDPIILGIRRRFDDAVALAARRSAAGEDEAPEDVLPTPEDNAPTPEAGEIAKPAEPAEQPEPDQVAEPDPISAAS